MAAYDPDAKSLSVAWRRLHGLLLAASLVATAAPVGAVTVLTAAKAARFDTAARRSPSAFVRVTNDAGLARLADPTCPTASVVAFSAARQSQVRTDSGDTSLPCEHWRATRRGFRYHDPAGSAAGVQEIVYEPGRLRVRAGGLGVAALAGPVIYVEAFLGIGEQHYLVRFYDFRINSPERVVSRPPSRAGAAGEAAFWETLGNWSPDTDRPLALLRKAVRERPSDGRSRFYLGALHVYLAAEGAPTSPSSLEHLSAAQEPLDRAVDLLPHDSVPQAFRAFTTYLNGIYRGDAAREALGRTQMEEATTANLFFNKAVALFIQPVFVSGASDDYQTRLLGWLDDVWTLSTHNPDVYPDVFTSRLVPHDPEGATLMFGDVAAKGGRLADAKRWYGVSLSLGASSAFPFQSIVRERLATVETRLAAHQEAPDPGTDSVIGVQGISDCTLCHYGSR
jgi:hypothetical protein